MAKKEKEKKKGSCLKTSLIIGAVVVVIGVAGGALGGNDSENKKVQVSSTQSNNSAESAQQSEAEPNTSAKVDEILLSATNDAKELSDSDAEQKWEEAFDYLKEHSDNFYENNEVMEKSMYYGEFIYRYIEENANADDVSQLVDSTRAAYDAGYNTVKAIKYVYRNAATPEDEDTQNALSEAQNALNKFK